MPRINFKNTSLFCLVIACCSCANHPIKENKAVEHDTLYGLTIFLRPSFSDMSAIDIDRTSNKMSFIVGKRGENAYTQSTPFSIGLDSFEAGTGIKLFYDSVFTNSIKPTPGEFFFNDGIDISTVLEKGDKMDTIHSGNSFSKKLSDNLVGQINFISGKTSDTSLKKYLVELKEYFH